MKTWNIERVRDTARTAPHNRKSGRPSDWAHADQRRTTGRWSRTGEYRPRYDAPPRG